MADQFGNLVVRRPARNLNPNMATAARLTTVEAEEIVELGELDADSSHAPGIYVGRIIKSTINETQIEKLTVRKKAAA